MINFLFPTIKNSFSPKIFENKFLAVFVIVLFGFNFLSFNYLPGFINKVEAGSINADDLISLTNSARTQAGLSVLNKNSQLTEAAKAKAADMFAKNYWAHFGPNGETPWQFIKGAGYSYIYAGENLAKGFVTSSAVHDAWMNSATHKANILKSEFRDIGIYVQDGILNGEETTLVVQMFGSQTDTSNVNTNTSVSSSKASTSKAKTSSQKTVTPVVKDTTPPDKPVITEPVNNKYTNTSSLVIKGTSENESNVYVYLNDVKNSEGKATNSLFEITLTGNLLVGDNLITAEAKDKSGNLSLKSDPIKVVYDITIPVIDKSSFKVVDKVDNSYTITFKVEEPVPLETLTASIGSQVFNVDTSNPLEYRILGVSDSLLRQSTITIHASDVAGNKSDFILENGALDIELSKYETTINNNSIFSEIVNSFTSMSLRQKVNLAIAIFLLVLLVIDGVILFRLKGLHPLRGKSVLHIPQLVVVIVILIFSGLGSVT